MRTFLCLVGGLPVPAGPGGELAFAQAALRQRDRIQRMRRAGVLALVLIVFACAPARQARAQATVGGLSRVAGVYDSTQYARWGAAIASGNSATGAQTVTICPAYISLPDGRQVNPFSTNVPLTFDPQNGAVTETVTPSAVSLVQPSGISGFPSCESVTATFTYAHGASLSPTQVISGDQGIQEAINDAQNNAYGPVPNLVYWVIDPGIVTLSTSGANTTLGSVNIPTRSVVIAATARVTTTIGTCAGGWSLGYSSGTEFGSANTTLTSGTTTDSSTLVPDVAFNASATAPIAHCTTSNASAGAIHARITGYKLVAPAN